VKPEWSVCVREMSGNGWKRCRTQLKFKKKCKVIVAVDRNTERSHQTEQNQVLFGLLKVMAGTRYGDKG